MKLPCNSNDPLKSIFSSLYFFLFNLFLIHKNLVEIITNAFLKYDEINNMVS